MQVISRFTNEPIGDFDISPGANLTGADLFEADLSGANLRWTNLFEADLSGANLSEADLTGANLVGADLSGVDLRGAILPDDIPRLDPAIFKQTRDRILATPTALKMDNWHTCRTTHCVFGHYSDIAGLKELEDKYSSGTLAHLIFNQTEEGQRIAAHFYDKDEDALEFLRSI